MITALEPPRAFASPFHSQGVLALDASRMVFVSGQGGVRSDGTPAEGITGQTIVAMENVAAVLAEADQTMCQVAKLTIFLTDHANIAPFVEAAKPFLPDPRPAATLLIVDVLADPRLLVQVEAIATGS